MNDAATAPSDSLDDQTQRAPGYAARVAEIQVRSKGDLRRLAGEIGSGARRHPIIAFALPAAWAGLELTPREVQAIVEIGAEVYLISSPGLTSELATLEGGVPLSLAIGSAWIWWPDARGERHSGQPELAEQIDLSRPAARAEIERLALQLAESPGAGAPRPALADAALAGDSSDTVLRIVELCALNTWAELEAFRDAGLDSAVLEGLDRGDRLRWLIFREWMRLAPSERMAHPIGYVFGPQFLNFVEHLPGVDEDRLAWACAMVACGAHSAQLRLRPVPDDRGARTGQLGRPDGAKAWEARPTARGRSDARSEISVLYWVRSSGCIEFGSLTCHDGRSASDD